MFPRVNVGSITFEKEPKLLNRASDGRGCHGASERWDNLHKEAFDLKECLVLWSLLNLVLLPDHFNTNLFRSMGYNKLTETPNQGYS